MNESWRLAPWAGLLYGCDFAWWRHRDGVPEFAGLKVGQDRRAAAAYGLELVSLRRNRHELLVDRPGVIGSFGNSGAQLVNLVVQFGARRVILVGFDYGGEHWHGRHPARLNNPKAEVLATWATRLDRQALRFLELGVEVLNASPISALKAYPKVTLSEALGG